MLLFTVSGHSHLAPLKSSISQKLLRQKQHLLTESDVLQIIRNGYALKSPNGHCIHDFCLKWHNSNVNSRWCVESLQFVTVWISNVFICIRQILSFLVSNIHDLLELAFREELFYTLPIYKFPSSDCFYFSNIVEFSKNI